MQLNNSMEHFSTPAPWTITDSERTYHIHSWGEPYFGINPQGHVQVSPSGEARSGIDLYELIQSLGQQGLDTPLLIRFNDILADRLARLHDCFERAIARYGYNNRYQGVYPVKCNQHRQLVENIVKAGQAYHFGLEAGSKPELMIAIAALGSVSETPSDTLLICNGYKDRSYIETALLASQLGLRIIIVVEQLEELETILATSQQLGIVPLIGVRAKLASQGIGRWGSSSGDRAKFGLTIPQVLQVVERLRQVDRLDCLQLLHYHIGSQISSISVVKAAIREAAQIYAELVKLGAKMGLLDVGGGLAVDYDGSKNDFPSSKNYNMQNYANDVVATTKDTCEEKKVTPPILISESGRAIAAHEAVLVFDVLSSSDVNPRLPDQLAPKEHLILRNLRETYVTITSDNYQEAYHDAVQFKEEAISLFNLGYLSLNERACAEELYWLCCHKIFAITQQQNSVPEDLAALEQNMASIYYANLSIFQSLPDAWAIHQLFPIMPIHRLTEKPESRGILADLTCDSDGRINQFIDDQIGNKTLLELHALNQSPYYLGVFLMGAYQEIMGNFHNLFANTHVVHVRLTDDGYYIDQVEPGNTIQEILEYVQYDAQGLYKTLYNLAEKAVLNKTLTSEQSQLIIDHYQRSLERYTYLYANNSLGL